MVVIPVLSTIDSINMLALYQTMIAVEQSNKDRMYTGVYSDCYTYLKVEKKV